MNVVPREEEEGAGNAGCALHPRSRVQKHKEMRTRAYRFSGGNPAFPAQWFYGFLRALPGDRAFLPPSLADRSTSLTPASGRQDHTTSPSAPVPFVKDTSASTASHRAFRDDRERPSCRVRRARPTSDLPDGLSGIFLRAGLDSFLAICPSGQFVAPTAATSSLRAKRSNP